MYIKIWLYSHIVDSSNWKVPGYAIYSTSLNESHVSLVNQSLYSSVEIRGTKSLKDQDRMHAISGLSTHCTWSSRISATKKGAKHSHPTWLFLSQLKHSVAVTRSKCPSTVPPTSLLSVTYLYLTFASPAKNLMKFCAPLNTPATLSQNNSLTCVPGDQSPECLTLLYWVINRLCQYPKDKFKKRKKSKSC